MRLIFAAAFGAFVVSCAATPRPSPPPPLPPAPPRPAGEPASVIIPDLHAAEAEHRWDPQICGELLARIEGSPDAEVLLYPHAVVLDRCGRADQARGLMAEAAELDDQTTIATSARIWLVLDTLERKGDPFLDEAAEQLDWIIRNEGFQTSYALVALARIQRRQAIVTPSQAEPRLEEAKRNLIRAVAVPESSATAWAELATFLLDRASADTRTAHLAMSQAHEVARAGLQHHPDSAIVRVVLGRIELARGDHEAARAAFAHAVERDGESADARVGLGHALLRLSRAEPAAEHFELALEREPDRYEALVGLATTQRLAGALDEADALLARARTTAPERPAAHFEVALVALAREGRVSQSVQAKLRRFLDAGDDPALGPARELARALLRESR